MVSIVLIDIANEKGDQEISKHIIQLTNFSRLEDLNRCLFLECCALYYSLLIPLCSKKTTLMYFSLFLWNLLLCYTSVTPLFFWREGKQNSISYTICGCTIDLQNCVTMLAIFLFLSRQFLTSYMTYGALMQYLHRTAAYDSEFSFLVGIASSKLIRGYRPWWSFFYLVWFWEFESYVFDLLVWTEHFVEQSPEDLHKHIITFRNPVHAQEEATKRLAQLPRNNPKADSCHFYILVFGAQTDQYAHILATVLIWFLREEGKMSQFAVSLSQGLMVDVSVWSEKVESKVLQTRISSERL